mgnify:CR=1 FL=1
MQNNTKNENKNMSLPSWGSELTTIYVRVRLSKGNTRLTRKYYREVELEKLRLAELGINQEKIRQLCRYLASQNCVRNMNCKYCLRIREFLLSPKVQLVLNFVN